MVTIRAHAHKQVSKFLRRSGGVLRFILRTDKTDRQTDRYMVEKKRAPRNNIFRPTTMRARLKRSRGLHTTGNNNQNRKSP